MDVRSWLSRDSFLRFPRMICRIKSYVGKGSNALVYLGEYEDTVFPGQYHEVLIKELFPLHPQGAIYRDSNGWICVASEGKTLYQLHKNSFERGNRIHLDLLKKFPSMVGTNVNTFSENGTLYTLMGCSGGVSLELAMQEEGITLRKITERMLALLDSLAVFHASSLLHLDISPDNILLIPQAQREHIVLIDYNSSISYAELQTNMAAYCSIKQGYTAPEISTGNAARIGFHSDLYSVAAVFFWCLMRRSLSLEEMIRATPPDGSESPYLANVPDTVRYMVKRILRRGLNSLIHRRYPDTNAMKSDFQELLDRIDGVGITHGALYESARKALDDFVRRNATFAFIRKAQEMYPLHFYNSDTDEPLDSDLFLKACLSADMPILLGASSGQGKTTALLHLATRQNASYSPQKTVAIFLSAYGYRPDEQWFIHDSILRMLKFKRETATYAAARHELDVLFSRPLGGAQTPTVLILLDGMNEIECDASPLIREFNELAHMQGVALVISSRSEVPGVPLRRIRLDPLTANEVSDALSRYGLLHPEDARMQQLLTTPLMLSLFVRTSLASRQQLSVSSAEELMQTMLRMEVNRYASDHPAHWQMDVAVHYVLPAIASSEQALNHSLTQRELLKVLARCYKTIRMQDMLRFYPQWIGHSKAIRNGAKNAEEWFSVIVQDLLWCRTGLLVSDEEGRYRIFHQQLKECLLDLDRNNQRRIQKRKLIRLAALSLLALMIGGLGWLFVWEPYIQPVINQMAVNYYPKEEAKEIVQASVERCSMGRIACENVTPYLDYANAGTVEYFDLFLPETLKSFESLTLANSERLKQQCAEFEHSVEDGVMPWSGNDFSSEEFSHLADFPTQMITQYIQSLNVLDWMMHNEKWYDRYSQEYIALFRELVQTDQELINMYYARLLKPEMDAMEAKDLEWYRELSGRYGEFESPGDSSATLDALLKNRKNILMLLNNGTAMDRYNQEQK